MAGAIVVKAVVGRWLIAAGLFVVLGGLLGTPFIHPARAVSGDVPSFASALKAEADLVSVALEGWAADGSAIVVSTPEQVFCLQLDGTSLPCPSIVIASSTGFEGESAARARFERTLGGAGWVMGRLQASPDGRWLAVERAPTGAETLPWAELWLADADGRASRLLARDGAYSPRWSPDGRTLAYLRAGSVWLLDLDTLAERSLALPPTAWPPRVAQTNTAPSAIPPETIRVAHHPSNTCRDRPAWAIDVIPFEEYVRRVVPAEVPASWPAAAVRAQAIAARTYAWYQVIRRSGYEYDVTDWTNFQVMCDATYPASDAAVAATAGQHLTYDGQPILAQYSAENGHPTLDGGLPYLRAVPDPVSLGKARWGHGHGLSQWGAYRWASQYNWDAFQILAHYYQGVEIRNPGDPSPPLVAMTGPWAGMYHTGQAVWLEANAAPASAIRRVAFWVDGQALAEDVVGADGWGAPLALDVLGAGAVITVSAETVDGAPVVGVNTLWIGGDGQPPQGGALLVPPTMPPPTITLQLQAMDDGPSGLQGAGISASWIWEGETFTGAPGGPLGDDAASNGWAWSAPAGAGGVWTSPPVESLPVGRIYRALFRLRTSAPLTTALLARLEVTAQPEGRLLGLADVRGINWRAASAYQEMAVDFWYDALAAAGLRFAVRFTGAAELALDRVLVVEYPTLQPPQGAWPLPDGARAGALLAAVFDRAGNSSDPQPVVLPYGEMPGPGDWHDLQPTGWVSQTEGLEARARVWARGGFEPAGAACRTARGDGANWSAWAPARSDMAAGAVTPVTLTCPLAAPDEGERLWVQMRAEDVHGRVGESPPFTLTLDARPPVVSLRAAGEAGAPGWFLGTTTVTVAVSDTVSGVASAWQRVAGGEWQPIGDPIVVEASGITLVEARAVDRAGWEAHQALTVAVDRTAPTVAVTAPTVTATPLIEVRWQGSDDASGVASYDVQARPDGQLEWTTWLTGTASESGLWTASGESGVSFRARAIDRAGRLGEWSPAVHVTTTARASFLPMVVTMVSED